MADSEVSERRMCRSRRRWWKQIALTLDTCLDTCLKKCPLLNAPQLEETFTNIHILARNILIILACKSIYYFASNVTLHVYLVYFAIFRVAKMTFLHVTSMFVNYVVQ